MHIFNTFQKMKTNEKSAFSVNGTQNKRILHRTYTAIHTVERPRSLYMENRISIKAALLQNKTILIWINNVKYNY